MTCLGGAEALYFHTTNLELHLLDGARKDRVANVLWALSTHIDNQQGVLSIDVEPADQLTLKEYMKNHPLNLHLPRVCPVGGTPGGEGVGMAAREAHHP